MQGGWGQGPGNERLACKLAPAEPGVAGVVVVVRGMLAGQPEPGSTPGRRHAWGWRYGVQRPESGGAERAILVADAFLEAGDLSSGRIDHSDVERAQ